MANSKEARKINRELREAHKEGVLEMIYERQDQPGKNKEAAATVGAKPVEEKKDESMSEAKS